MAGRRGKGKGKRRRRGGAGRPLEWIGGRLSPPWSIEDREEPYRPEIAVWLERPSGLVVGQELCVPENVEGAVGRALRAALERPLSGSPRSPDAIRVAEASLAAEVQAVVGGAIPVVVAPTPEIDGFLNAMLEWMAEQGEREINASYLEGGRVPPEAVEDLFGAARLLYRAAPWQVATDDQVLRMDIPALGVEGACVSIIGNLGESLGLVVFPSLDSYEAFRGIALEPPGPGRRLDVGTGWLALNFERAADLPDSMRREVKAHGWPVAGADAWPWVVRHDRDGSPLPVVERDVKIAAACARMLSEFFSGHRELFEADSFEPVCVSYYGERNLEVRFTAPYEAFPMFDVDPESRYEESEIDREELPPVGDEGARAVRDAPSKVRRNEPCLCGSGRKYKRCCLPSDEQARGGSRDRHSLHRLDERVVRKLSELGMARFDFSWDDLVEELGEPEVLLPLLVPWSVYEHRIEGATLADRYLEEHGRRLSGAERAWIESQRAAWLSIWEVIAVEPGASLTLRDLLSGETRCAHEVSGSRMLVVRDAVLGRVVDHEGVSLVCGMHGRALPPIEAAEVVRRARGRLRRRRAVPVERLREDGFGRYLIRRWEEAVADLDASRATPPTLQNTDGEPLLVTTDHFEIAPGARQAVEEQLAALEHAEPTEPEAEPRGYDILRPGNPMHASWENTLIGRIRLSDTGLWIETNSRERADALRAQVEAACGDLLRHRAREHADPLSKKAAPTGHSAAPAPPPPEAEEILRQYKQQHYADWIDQPLPALHGRTPREAVRTAHGRAAVDVLLKDMENHEQRWDSGAAFDFSELRRQLRLD